MEHLVAAWWLAGRYGVLFRVGKGASATPLRWEVMHLSKAQTTTQQQGAVAHVMRRPSPCAGLSAGGRRPHRCKLLSFDGAAG